MDVSVTLKLFMTDTQKNAFKETMRAFNSACSIIAEKYGDETNRIRLHHKTYDETRSLTGLSSQFVVRAIGRVADANKTRVAQTKSKKLRRRAGKHWKPVVFREYASVPYDARLSDLGKLWSRGEVSLSTCSSKGKRETVGVSLNPHSATMLLSGHVRAGSLLSYRPRDDVFYLTLVVELPDAEEITPRGVIGIDMGVVNIATLSDGTNYSGENIERTRERFAKVRKELQEHGTPSARKRLKKIGGREARYRRDVNHCISKKIVGNAKGIAKHPEAKPSGLSALSPSKNCQASTHGQPLEHQSVPDDSAVSRRPTNVNDQRERTRSRVGRLVRMPLR